VPAPTIAIGCTSGNTGNLATITVTGNVVHSIWNYEFIKVVGTNTQVQFSASNVYRRKSSRRFIP
jgi:hypothetical protein